MKNKNQQLTDIKRLEQNTDRRNRAFFQHNLTTLYRISYSEAVQIYNELEQESIARLG